jgi:ABC-type phosphate transport system substrate-binding protein
LTAQFAGILEAKVRRFTTPAVLILAFPLVLVCISCGSNSSSTSSSSSSAAASGEYFVCYTSSNAHGITISAVFRVPPVDQVTMLEEPWAKDFRRYVGQSGDEGGISVTCSQVDPKNPDAALKDKIDAWRKQGIPVAQVNWKYAGG